MSSFSLAIAQINPTLGDFVGNSEKIAHAAKLAQAQGADVLVTPEMSLCGYPAQDAWLRHSFLEACDNALIALAKRCPLPTLVGHPWQFEGALFNAVSWIERGAVLRTTTKQCLPNFSVFDEQRYFKAGHETAVWEINHHRLAILICEDIWHAHPMVNAMAHQPHLAIVMNASPYRKGVMNDRQHHLNRAVQQHGIPIVYVNAVGGQDELVFDGGSLAVNPPPKSTPNSSPSIFWQAPLFAEHQALIHYRRGAWCTAHPPSTPIVHHDTFNINTDHDSDHDLSALGLALNDYLRKNRFSKVVIGISGGVDSALTLAIAVSALGSKAVSAVMLPSRYTSKMSVDDAQTLCQNLNVPLHHCSIESINHAIIESLAPLIGHLPTDLTEENIQARIRGLLLMALANKSRALVINTSNKSEMAVGYGTLYGDMVGGFALLKDLYKHEVYALCRVINRERTIIPERILTRAPTAELRDNQTDQDSLPPYEVLDAVLFYHLEQGMGAKSLVELGLKKGWAGWNADTINRILHLVRINEYKRSQAPIGPKLSSYAFGRDHRMPVSQFFTDRSET